MSMPPEAPAPATESADDPTGMGALEEDLAEPEEAWHSTIDDPVPSHRRCVIHIDIDCFYAQVEMLERPELRDKPLGIQQKNIVVTSNYAARARGVGKCCLVMEALQTCPELVLVNGSDLTRYRRMSARIHRLLTGFSRRVERLGFDENFLDVTESVMRMVTRAKAGGEVEPSPGHSLGSVDSCSCGCAGRLRAAAGLAADIRRALRDELGISSCAGIGFNKLLAKLAGATHKPNQQTVLYAGGVDDLLSSAGTARALPGVGSRTAAQLAKFGVKTVGDLRRSTPLQLRSLGSPSVGAALRALAFGVDPAEVKPSSAALSIGVEDGFRRVDSVDECEVKIRELTRRVLVLLAEDGRVPAVLKLSIRRYNREDYGRFRESRQTKMPPSLFARWREKEVEIVDRLVAEAMVLLKKMLKDEPFHLTLLGLAVTGFNEQSNYEQPGIAKFVQKGSSTAAKRKGLCGSADDGTPPDGVDPSVWVGLPPDIKSELLRDQELGPSKKRRQQSIASFFGAAADSSCGLKDNVELVTLDDDPIEAMVTKEAPAADGSRDAIGVASRSSSRSPKELIENDFGHSDPDDLGSDCNTDDPVSPVISRSAAARCEVISGDFKGADTGVRDSADSCTINDCGDGAVRPQPAGTTAPPVTSPAEEPASSGDGAEHPAVTSSHVMSAVPDGDPTASAAAGQQTSASPASRSPVGGTESGSADLTGDLRVGGTADGWDPDVFSQLPPDIQFELKMARRSERRGTTPTGGGAAGPRRPAAATKNGTILKFFKR